MTTEATEGNYSMKCIIQVNTQSTSSPQYMLVNRPEPHPYSSISHLLDSRIVVGICAFGIIGNILTLILLLHRRKKLAERRAQRTSESANCARSDVWCFIALSISDFLFCVCLLPQWKKGVHTSMYRGFSYMIIYEQYESAIVNTFVMSSTWLTVSMTVNRYINLCHPIWAMRYLGGYCLRMAIMISILFSVLFNLPRFWFMTVGSYDCLELKYSPSYTYYYVESANRTWEEPYLWAYFVIGIVFPLCSLSYSNTRIIMAVCRSMAIEQRRNQERNVITRTLIFVVCFYVFLVSPAELMKFFEPISGYHSSPGTYGLVISIADILQAINFSCNFLPYLVLDKSIRRGILQAGCQKRHENGPPTSIAVRPHDYTFDGVSSTHAPNRHMVHGNDSIVFSAREPSTTEMTRLYSRCILADPNVVYDKDVIV